ncbi:uncharacterized protein TNIN_120401 [Trichonephila inaurata madagascariensis]|uniref:Uncharacterized protein n=1 Tax=Trichonephila inaurata madagascariensis TaxID=2747483 RepID=A0A8X6XY03_9ARAC|nr:uncharacterized protein TNIN_120401 [Trichonephila inaurata madagascariensis]
MDNQKDILEILRKAYTQMNIYSEDSDAVSDKEYTEIDYQDTPNPNFDKCRVNYELNDTKQKLNAAVASIFFRENCSEEYEGSDNSPNILNGNLTELQPSVSIEEVSDSSRAFSSGDEMNCLTSESEKVKSSQNDVQATVSRVAESKASFSEGFKSCNNTDVHESVANNGSSVNSQFEDLIKTSSTKNDSKKKGTSLTDDSFSSDGYEYSNEIVALSRNLESIMHVTKLTGTSLGDTNIESDNSKPVGASTNNDSMQVQNSKSDLGQVVTESSYDDEDSMDGSSDSDESFSWYYNEPEDFDYESERNSIPQDAEAQVMDGLVKFSLPEGKSIKSDVNDDDVISLLSAGNDSTVLSSDEESIDDMSVREERLSWYYNESDFIDEPLRTEFQSDESMVASCNAAIYPEVKNVMSYDLAIDGNLTADNDRRTALTFRDDSFSWYYVEPENIMNERFGTSSNLPSNLSIFLGELERLNSLSNY